MIPAFLAAGVNALKFFVQKCQILSKIGQNTAMRNIGPLLTANAADQICELYLA